MRYLIMRCSIVAHRLRGLPDSLALINLGFMPDPETNAPAPAAAGRAWQLHVRTTRRSIAARSTPRNYSLAGIAGVWLVPWTKADFPGVYKGLVEILGWRVSIGTMRSWLDGRRNTPSWAAQVLGDAIEARLAQGQDVLVKLRAYQVEKELIEAQPKGFRLIDPVTGTDGRNKHGKSKRPDK